MNKKQPVLCMNVKTGKITRFESVKETAEFFCVTVQTIFQYFESGKPYKKTWCFDYPFETESEVKQ